MASNSTICLIGPKSAGKSSLLQTFIDCVELGGHGFSRDYKINVQDIDEADYSGGNAIPRILGGNSGIYRDHRSAFFTTQRETDSTNDYFFRLTASRTAAAKSPAEAKAEPILLRIVDSAGEYAVKEDYGTARFDNPADSVNKLNDALTQADAVIVVIPIVDMGRATFVGPLSSVISKLVNTNGEKPHRIVIAFTQYEKLFVRTGRDAFTTASLRGIARNVIRRAVLQGRWTDDLKRFDEMPGRRVYFTVTSSYGFAKGYGIPNIDPHWAEDGAPPSEQLFGKPDRIATFWRPFLTADPFISAAIDQPGELTFTFETLRLPDDPPPPPPEFLRPGPPELVARLNRTKVQFSRIRDWFNRVREE